MKTALKSTITYNRDRLNRCSQIPFCMHHLVHCVARITMMSSIICFALNRHIAQLCPCELLRTILSRDIFSIFRTFPNYIGDNQRNKMNILHYLHLHAYTDLFLHNFVVRLYHTKSFASHFPLFLTFFEWFFQYF